MLKHIHSHRAAGQAHLEMIWTWTKCNSNKQGNKLTKRQITGANTDDGIVVFYFNCPCSWKTDVLTSQMALTLPEFMTSALFRKRCKSVQNFNRHTMQVSVEREREKLLGLGGLGPCFFLKGRWYNLTEFQLHHLGSVFHHHVPTTSAILVLSSIFGQNPSRKRQLSGKADAHSSHLNPPGVLNKAQECSTSVHMAVCQNLVPVVNIKIAGKWMFIPLKMVLIGIDPSPYGLSMPMVRQWFVNICWYIIVSECPRMYQNMFQYIRMQQNIGTMCYMRETMWNMPRKGKKTSRL